MQENLVGNDNIVTRKAILSKLDARLVPWITLLYLWSWLDRVNIGNVKIMNMSNGVSQFQKDLNLSADEFNWALSIFFFGYIIFEIPSNLMLKRATPRKWIARIVVSWGICSTCMAAVTNYSGLLATRFFLGLMEAGLFPGVLFYLSFWYPRKDLAFRIAMLLSAATAAGAFGGLLAYSISFMNGVGGLSAWRWLFIIEGVPTIFLGFATYWVLPNSPNSASFLTEKERDFIINQLRVDGINSEGRDFNKREFYSTLCNFKIWLYMLVYIGIAGPAYGIAFFFPSIITGFGFDPLNSQLLTIPPYIIASIVLIAGCFSSDFLQDRFFHLITFNAVTFISFLVLALSPHNVPLLYVFGTLVITCVYSQIPISIVWQSNNMVGVTTSATAMAMMISFGNIGGIIGTEIYRSVDAPTYKRGHLIMAGLTIFSGICATILYGILKLLNKRKRLMADNVDQVDTISTEKDPRFFYQL